MSINKYDNISRDYMFRLQDSRIIKNSCVFNNVKHRALEEMLLVLFLSLFLSK